MVGFEIVELSIAASASFWIRRKKLCSWLFQAFGLGQVAVHISVVEFLGSHDVFQEIEERSSHIV